MLQNYAKAIDDLNQCDVLGVIGYAFNHDDGHINSILRDFLSKNEKQIIIFHYVGNNTENTEDYTKFYQERLRLTERLC